MVEIDDDALMNGLKKGICGKRRVSLHLQAQHHPSRVQRQLYQIGLDIGRIMGQQLTRRLFALQRHSFFLIFDSLLSLISFRMHLLFDHIHK